MRLRTGIPSSGRFAGGVRSRRMGGGALHGLEARIPEGRTDWNLPVRVNVFNSDFGILETSPVRALRLPAAAESD